MFLTFFARNIAENENLCEERIQKMFKLHSYANKCKVQLTFDTHFVHSRRRRC